MTVHGFFKQLDATCRRMEREAARRQRQRELSLKLQAKQNALEYARASVALFEERMEFLSTIHHTCGESVDWHQVAARSQPEPPGFDPRRERIAMMKLEGYRPGFFSKLLGTEARKRERLKQAVQIARNEDEAAYKKAHSAYVRKWEEWSALTTLARRICAGEVSAYQEALEELNPLSEISDMGCRVEWKWLNEWTVEVILIVNDDDVVPNEVLSLTKTGKLSAKAIPKMQFHALYQDYVCGCALRIAREMCAFLPAYYVLVHAQRSTVDSMTGHLVTETVLSVGMQKPQLDALNMPTVDPSDAMNLFPHRMGFKKTQGMARVRPMAMDECFPST